jgi:hypothetical protein
MANTVSNFPFYSLSDKEFKSLFGSWSGRKPNDFDLYDLFLNPDKSDDSDPDIMLCNPCSDYYSIKKLKTTFQTFQTFLMCIYSSSTTCKMVDVLFCFALP